jgi:hypothetical protein
MAARLLAKSRVLLLGGSGLVGTAIARRLTMLQPALRPSRIIVASMLQEQTEETIDRLNQLQQSCFSHSLIEFIPEWGDIFVRSEFAHTPREELLQNHRKELLEDMYDDFSSAYERSYLVKILRKHRPNVLIDSVNTATGLSYQNAFDAAIKVRQTLASNNVHQEQETCQHGNISEDAERLLLTQSVPALVRHIQILSKASEEINLENYMKVSKYLLESLACKPSAYGLIFCNYYQNQVGTTGTGGMGLNLPFTHSEGRPSNLILAKNEAGFGHSGLLYLWGQTPGAPAVHEIKPAAAIGYRDIDVHNVTDRFKNQYIRQPRLMNLTKEKSLNVRENESDYAKLQPMAAVTVDMGENGFMTADEFRILSAPGSMEMISPEEIAEVCVQELLGIGTGHNILASIRSSVLGPGFRAGVSRTYAENLFDDLEEVSVSTKASTVPSVALGRLGPPQLSKILFEAHMLKLFFGDNSLKKLADCDNIHELSQKLSLQAREAVQVQSDSFDGSITIPSITHVAPSIGVPVLLHNNELVRGANITIPEPRGYYSSFEMTESTIRQCAQNGWIDLTTSNLEQWRLRARHILSEPEETNKSAVCIGFRYNPDGNRNEINPAAIASWILAGELHGQRDLDSVHCALEN